MNRFCTKNRLWSPSNQRRDTETTTTTRKKLYIYKIRKIYSSRKCQNRITIEKINHFKSGNNYMKTNAKFEAFMAVMFQVEVFWIVTPCSAVAGYQSVRGPCCFYPEDRASLDLWNVGILPQHYKASQVRIFRHETTWRWRQHGPLKRWHPITLHGFTSQKTSAWTSPPWKPQKLAFQSVVWFLRLLERWRLVRWAAGLSTILPF